MTAMHKTRCARPGRRPIELEGRYLWEVTATTGDGQIETVTVAADTSREAQTHFHFASKTMRLRGQLVAYQVRQLDEEVAS
jgi:hypothetical protein